MTTKRNPDQAVQRILKRIASSSRVEPPAGRRGSVEAPKVALSPDHYPEHTIIENIFDEQQNLKKLKKSENKMKMNI